MNPGKYTMRIPRGGRYDVIFNFKDSANQPVSMDGYLPVLTIYRGDRGGDLVMSSLPVEDPHIWGIDLIVEPEGVTGRVAVAIGSDITGNLLVPYGQLDLGMRFRLELLSASLGGQVILLLVGPVVFFEES